MANNKADIKLNSAEIKPNIYNSLEFKSLNLPLICRAACAAKNVMMLSVNDTAEQAKAQAHLTAAYPVNRHSTWTLSATAEAERERERGSEKEHKLHSSNKTKYQCAISSVSREM